MSLKRYCVIVAAISILWLHNSSADELAIKKFRAALETCEEGMQMEPPKSHSSLRVLQSLLRKYQRNMREALGRDESLKESTTLRYSGNFLVEKTFGAAYQMCESGLSTKVEQAKTDIEQRQNARKTLQEQTLPEQEALIQKVDAAREQVIIALNQHCINYLKAPTTPTDPISPLYQKYQAAKQHALETYPEIVKQFHKMNLVDPDTGEEQATTKTIQSWFDYCEAAFTHQQEFAEISEDAQPEKIKASSPKTVEEGPMPASTVKPLVSEQPTVPIDETEGPVPAQKMDTVDDEPDAESEAEYQAALKKVQGDRLTVLKEEKQLPTYIDDDNDDLQRAKIWQYEDEKQCITYKFKGNKLVAPKTVSAGECPML